MDNLRKVLIRSSMFLWVEKLPIKRMWGFLGKEILAGEISNLGEIPSGWINILERGRRSVW